MSTRSSRQFSSLRPNQRRNRPESMKALHLILLTGLTCLICSPLDAQRKGKGGGGANRVFAQLDKNDDGKITVAEAKGSRIAARFAKIDKDKDGAITQAEFSASRAGEDGGRKGRGRKGEGRGGKGRGEKGRGGKGRGEKGRGGKGRGEKGRGGKGRGDKDRKRDGKGK